MDMDIDTTVSTKHDPMEDTPVEPRIIENPQAKVKKMENNLKENTIEQDAPREQRMRKNRGLNGDLVISSNFSKTQNTQPKEQGDEEDQRPENSPPKTTTYQQKEVEMMELLSSIIMDEATSTEKEQEEKIQNLIQGIYKEIKPDQKIIQQKKKYTFARLPRLQNNESKLLNKYIQALHKTGKAALFQVKRNLKEWLLGVAKYRWIYWKTEQDS